MICLLCTKCYELHPGTKLNTTEYLSFFPLLTRLYLCDRDIVLKICTELYLSDQ